MTDWWSSNQLFGLEYADPGMTNAHWWLSCALLWGMLMVVITTACALTNNPKGVRIFSIGILLSPLGPVNFVVAIIVTVSMFTYHLTGAIIDAWRRV